MKKVLMIIVGLGLAGCMATTNKSDSVEIGLEEARSTCTRLGDLKCSGYSKPELRAGIKNQAADLGANYVKVRSMTLQREKGTYQVSGVAFLCQ
jgi:hypothetical protein